MEKTSISIVLAIILSFVLFSMFSNFVFGQEKQADTSYALEAPLIQEEAKDMGDYLTQVYKFLVYACIIAALFAITIGGYFYLTAAGDANKVEKGKDIIINAIMGLALALFAWVLLNTISPQFVTPSKLGEKLGLPAAPPGAAEPTTPTGPQPGLDTAIELKNTNPQKLYADRQGYALNNLADPGDATSIAVPFDETRAGRYIGEKNAFSLKGPGGEIYTMVMTGGATNGDFQYNLFTWINKDGKLYYLPRRSFKSAFTEGEMANVRFNPTPNSPPVTIRISGDRGIYGLNNLRATLLPQ